MITAFLSAMSPDGYNPYRIGRDGIDWEVIEIRRSLEPHRLLGRPPDHLPAEIDGSRPGPRPGAAGLACGTERCSASPTFPTGSRPTPSRSAHPKHTHGFRCSTPTSALMQRREQVLGADGLRAVRRRAACRCWPRLGEKLAIILLAKAGSLLPGAGLWLHTQRPEWNDANNALVGNGVSVVTPGPVCGACIDFLLALPAAQSRASAWIGCHYADRPCKQFGALLCAHTTADGRGRRRG
jgi:hypothetical protein